jgi:ATP-binding cassette, subfamily F, member 3
VVLISHDRHIIETCVDELWLVNDGTVKRFDGDMDDYTRLVLDKSRAGRRAAKTQAAKAEVLAPSPPVWPSAAAAQKAILKLDRQIDDVRSKIEILDKALSDASLYSEEPKKAADFTRLRTKLAADLEALETRWLEAHEA